MHLFPCLKYLFSKGLFVTSQAWSPEWSRKDGQEVENRNEKSPKTGRELGKTLFDISEKLMVCI